MAEAGGAITINFEDESVIERLNALTAGKGPEKCIDAVGMEAHVTHSLDSMLDRAKQAVMLETDRPHVLREMMYVCRPAGTLSVPGVYGGILDKLPFGGVMNKGLTIRTGQTHVNRWADDLLRRIEEGEIEQLQAELNAILRFVEQLSEVDVSGVEPMTSVTPMLMKKREDVVTDGGDAEAILKNAPAREGDYFVVPKVVE